MEYANIKLFKLKNKEGIDEDKVKEYLKKYRQNKKLKPVLVDNDYNIIKNLEVFLAGKKLGVKYLESSRIKSKFNSTYKFPSAILLELTNRCNLFCRMCPRNQLTRPLMDMDYSTFRKIVDEISKHKLDGLWLYNIGESMIHPKFFEMLDYVSKLGCIHPLWLSTNGTTLNEKSSIRLLNSGLDYLNFSLNALDAQNHKIISGRSNFDLVMHNLNNFIRLKKKLKKRKPFLRLQLIDQPEVHNQLDKFVKRWGPKVDIISINALETFVGQKEIPSNIILRASKYQKNIQPCKRIGRGFLYIFSNNKVGICATDFNCINSVGNLSTMTIKEVWTGKKYKQLYSNITKGNYKNIPFCYSCNDRHLA